MLDADGDAPVTFTYNRNATTNVVTTVSLTCAAPAGQVTRVVPVSSNVDEGEKSALVREMCIARVR